MNMNCNMLPERPGDLACKLSEALRQSIDPSAAAGEDEIERVVAKSVTAGSVVLVSHCKRLRRLLRHANLIEHNDLPESERR